MTPHSRTFLRRLAVLLAGLSMFGPFAIDTIFPAFPELERDFAATPLAVQQTISAYLVAYALMSLLHGPLSDARGRRPVILWGIVVFVLASIGAALSQNLAQLLAFRAIQGASAGTGMIVGRAVIRDLLDGQEAQKLMAQTSMIFSVAPAIAPVVGGYILGWWEWPAIFWVLAGFSLLMWLACWLWLPETHPAERRIPMNVKSLVAGNWEVMSNPRFAMLAAATSFGFGSLFLYVSSAPVLVLDILHLNQRQFAWFFVPMIGGFMIGAFISGRIAGRVPVLRGAAIGFALSGIALVLNLVYNLAVDQAQVPWAVLPMMLNTIGIGIAMPAMTLAALDMYPHRRGAAASMHAFAMLACNAFLAGVLSPLVSHHRTVMAGTALAMWILGFALFVIWRRGGKARLAPEIMAEQPIVVAQTVPEA